MATRLAPTYSTALIHVYIGHGFHKVDARAVHTFCPWVDLKRKQQSTRRNVEKKIYSMENNTITIGYKMPLCQGLALLTTVNFHPRFCLVNCTVLSCSSHGPSHVFPLRFTCANVHMDTGSTALPMIYKLCILQKFSYRQVFCASPYPDCHACGLGMGPY